MRLTVNGASHASAIRFQLEGFPSDFPIDEAALANFMERRAPGRDALSTTRREPDKVELKRHGKTVEGVIRNTDTRPQDYGSERTIPRPGHADFGQWVELGRIPTGGGKNSGRMTAALCAAGGICKQLLEARGLTVEAQLVRVGKQTDAAKFEAEILAAKKDLDSVGGAIRCRVTGMRPGVGGALFDGLESAISQAVFAIPGVKGIAFGNGFEAAELRGSENNDAFVIADGDVRTATNRHGGILGGRSTGMPIEFTVAMKPTPTIYKEQDSVDLATMTPVRIAMKGRHDPCIVRRAVPVVEAMAAYALADKLLFAESNCPRICLTLTGKTIAEDLAQYRSQKLFTDMVELRVDLLERGERDAARDFPKRVPVPVLLTCRRKCDGGAWTGSESARAKLLKALLGAGGFAYVDLESDFHLCDKIKGVKIVRSAHCFDSKIPKLAAAKGEILKLAVKGKDISTGVKLLKRFADDEREHVVMAMGYEGFFTRALACKSHSKWVYASVGGLSELGHVTPKELVRDFRIRDIKGAGCDLPIYGVTGWPLKKTRSPELHNAAFLAEDNPARMVPLPCADIRKVLKAMDELDMRGLAVTIPHKQTIMPLLDAVDCVAKAVGAVNTVLRESDGKLIGYNTDVAGFTRAIVEFAGDLKGRCVALLGDGGAAKACKYALKKLGAKVTVFHRKPLTDGFGVIVNATPVDPISEYRFRGDELVYDLRYVPETTELMVRAAAAGCKACNGFSMLRYQAEEQRKIWAHVF